MGLVNQIGVQSSRDHRWYKATTDLRRTNLSGWPQNPGGLCAQISLALDNLEAVLAEAGMDPSNVLKLGIYTVDVDEALKNFDLMGGGFARTKLPLP